MLGWLLLIGLSGLSADATPAAVFPARSLDEACREADTADKLVLVYFKEADNPDVEQLEERTLADPAVKAWLGQHVLAIEPVPAEETDLVNEFAVGRRPALVVVGPDGIKRAHVAGAITAQTMLDGLQGQIEASDPVVTARRRLEGPGRNDPAARLAYAKALHEAEQYDDALKQLLRCIDAEPEPDDQVGGGARYVAIAEAGTLIADCPLARQALETRRDAAQERLLAGRAGRFDAALVAAFDRALGTPEHTAELYEQMKERYPQTVSTALLRQSLVDNLLQARAYDQIDKLIDVAKYAERAYETHLEDARRPLPESVNLGSFRAFERRTYVERSSRYYEMLVGMEHNADAARVAAWMLEVDDVAYTRFVLARAALRTGRPSEWHLQYAREAVAASNPPSFDMLVTLVDLLKHFAKSDEAAQLVARYAPQLTDPEEAAQLRRLAPRCGALSSQVVPEEPAIQPAEPTTPAAER